MNRDTVIAKLSSTQAQGYIDSVRAIFKDLPHLPANIREVLAKIIPWLTIVGAVLSAISGALNIFVAVGVTSTDPEVLPRSDSELIILGLLSLLSAYISFLAFPLLKERNYSGWILLFWSSVLSAVMSLVTLFFGDTSILGVVLGTAIGFYLTFEIESLYTVSGKTAAIVSEVTGSVKKAVAKPKKRTPAKKTSKKASKR